MKEEPCDTARAHTPTPTVDVDGDWGWEGRGFGGEYGCGAAFAAGGLREVEDGAQHRVELGSHRAHAHHHGLAAALLGETRAHLGAFLVREERNIDRAGDMAPSVFPGRANVHHERLALLRGANHGGNLRRELGAARRELEFYVVREALHDLGSYRGIFLRDRGENLRRRRRHRARSPARVAMAARVSSDVLPYAAEDHVHFSWLFICTAFVTIFPVHLQDHGNSQRPKRHLHALRIFVTFPRVQTRARSTPSNPSPFPEVITGWTPPWTPRACRDDGRCILSSSSFCSSPDADVVAAQPPETRPRRPRSSSAGWT